MERSRLATLAFCGSYAGAVVGLPMSGMLTEWLGWETCFYFYGMLGLAWYASWMWLSFEKPAKHPTISRDELAYIESSIGLVTSKPPTVSPILHFWALNSPTTVPLLSLKPHPGAIYSTRGPSMQSSLPTFAVHGPSTCC